MRLVPILIFSILIIGIIPAAVGQTDSIASNVVINEVELNPPGDDSKSIIEWVELYNPTDTEIDLSGWHIASTTVLKKTMTIDSGTTIQPNQFLTFSYLPVWFTDVSESIELRDSQENIIDKTPTLTDLKNDFTSWQRLYDGYDTNSPDDWEFVVSTAGSTNGKLSIQEEVDGVSISIDTDKSQYLFGEAATINGKVSEKVFVYKPYFQPEKIILDITGPSYQNSVTLFPDLNLNYKTTINLQKVLGISEGTYDVSVSYAGASAQTTFSVGTQLVEEIEGEEGQLTINTNEESFIPGQTVTMSATTSDIVQFAGLKFKVIDPNGIEIEQGTLFPNLDANKKAVRGGTLTANPSAQFTTSFFMNTVKPVYGTYRIIGEYSTQQATTTFELVKDEKEEKTISLWTDKDIYSLGDTVKITGRINTVWIPALDLEIVQTKNIAISKKTFEDSGGFAYKETGVVRIAGDGTFSHEFKVPTKETRLGDYRIKVSKDIGEATKSVKVVRDPESFVESKEPLSLSTDKQIYELGDKMIIRGSAAIPVQRSSFEIQPVEIYLTDDKNNQLSIVGLPKEVKVRERGGVDVAYKYTAVPDFSGNYKIETTVNRSFFGEGTYFVNAKYGDLSTRVSFVVDDPAKTGERLTVSLNKDVFGLGEKVTVSGLVPHFVQGNKVEITVIKPNGETDRFSVISENSRFMWSWTIPSLEKQQKIGLNERIIKESNFGIYKIRLSTSSVTKELLFKVSENPLEDTLLKEPLTISTAKKLYKPGEKLKVNGFVQQRQQGTEGLVVPERVSVKILSGKFPHPMIQEGSVYPTQGVYKLTFDLPATVFKDGEYKIQAKYQKNKAETSIVVDDDFEVGGDAKLALNVNFDKEKYHPGDTVRISGKPNKLVFLEQYEVSVIKRSEKTSITCGSFYCGTHVGPVISIRPEPNGSFTYEFKIPDKPSSLGKYETIVDIEFDTVSKTFEVVEKPPEDTGDKILGKKLIEKENRIPDRSIEILTKEKTSDGKDLAPRLVQASLLTPIRGDETDVNMRVTSESGLCVIGQNSDCLIQESTRSKDSIFTTVEIDTIQYKIRYSGPDARLEKFSIQPSKDAFLPDTKWNVDVIKENQVSRLYYKVNYVELE
ncbi:MAG: hypothetical protein GWN01_12080 [Nitrosopumilaceae archaeon]|nr:hypothetical protein [Nitrosopumilaceae archaeon]NIU01614.1 hypothetical protein [Nitrosopumilaceae archaeon]NIU88033.1 hypothetical protein [Nitrosopumilaceae archaeon]NIV66300.1 hypothetical protein [Nitrosopumilaceae archaeon]NIX62216.1 hypothetical protein [Nitrosopumilaceae archaeon]